MSVDAIAAATAVPQTAATGIAGVQSFTAAFEQALARQAAPVDGGALESLLSPLVSLGDESAKLQAQVAPLGGSELRPSELMMITMRSHEFLFRCELTANVANRASDGVQQLFRQQS